MEIWYSIPVEKCIVLFIHLQIGIWGVVLRNLIVFIGSNVNNLSSVEEVAKNKRMKVNQVISQRRKDLQMWGTNYGFLLQLKSTQMERLHSMKESTLEGNNDIGSKITVVEIYVK